MTNALRTGPATISCDVLVVGGGAAGVAAATAAGRAGAQVVLLERYGFLGGLATAAQVGTICGLYLRDTANPEALPVAGGFVQEYRLAAAARRRCRADAAGGRPLGAAVSHTGLRPRGRRGDRASPETSPWCCTPRSPRRRPKAPAWSRSAPWRGTSRWSHRPRTVVDCSGEATAAALAGAGVENGVADQAPSLVFVMENIDPGLAERGLLEVRRELRRAVEAGSLPAACERLALVPGMDRNGRLALKLNLAVAESDRPLWQQVTDWEREARALVDELQRFLVKNIAACRNARLASIAPQLGIRSGRRIQGRARLADEDVLAARKSPLGIARGCWPMERWGNGPRPEMTFFSERDYYEIPLDCLRPVGLDNVLAAGRCLSAEAGAMTSARVIGTALATGWAAGTVAAFQALGRPLDAAVETIRQQMNSQSQS